MQKILFALTLLAPFASADEKAKMKIVRKPELAAVGPIAVPGRKDEMVRFLACSTENECLKLLQQADLTPSSNEETFVAEFVESPKKGVAVYRRKVAENK